MEQTTAPEVENRNITPQETPDDTPIMEETHKNKNNTNEIKTPENTQNVPKNTQESPENSQNTPLQEEPLNTRGEKYNLRPNPNPNYSDSYRYCSISFLEP